MKRVIALSFMLCASVLLIGQAGLEENVNAPDAFLNIKGGQNGRVGLNILREGYSATDALISYQVFTGLFEQRSIGVGLRGDNKFRIFGQYSARDMFSPTWNSSTDDYMIFHGGFVGMGVENPQARLHLKTYEAANLPGIISEVAFRGNQDIAAIQGKSVTNDGWGVGGEFEGGYYGVSGLASGGSYQGRAIGIYGSAVGNSGSRIGVEGNASGGDKCYGLLGIAEGGNRNYAIMGQGDVKASGRLFVGTSEGLEDKTTDFELVVNGDVICERLKVKFNANWPDYVFAEDYPLASLEELETYIQSNGRLPGFPQANEVENGGYFVEEIQSQTLKMVEEIVLHLIKVNQKNEALTLEMQNLQARFDKLRQEMLELKKER